MSKKKAVRGIIGELDLGDGPFLTLDMPRHSDKARMSFNLEAIFRHEFFGKVVLIVEDFEEETPVDPKKPNIVARIKGKGNKKVLWVGHIDVVPEGKPENWTYPPYSGTIAEGCVWGRGSSDMKGSCAAAMVSARANSIIQV